MLVLEDRQPYVDYDYLWKKMITDLFEDFIQFVIPELYDHVDWSKKPLSLEQELHKISSGIKKGQRTADKLFNVHLKNGTDQWILIHIEIQGSKDPDFSKRMFQYYYRIFDKHNKDIVAIALLTDSNRSFHPNKFTQEMFGTKLSYKYNSIKLMSLNQEQLKASKSPIALTLLAGQYLVQSKWKSELRYQYKRELIKLVLQDETITRHEKSEVISTLLFFIDKLLRIPNEYTQKLEYEIQTILKEENRMDEKWNLEDAPTFKGVFEALRKEEREEGRSEGEKAKAIAIAKKMLLKGLDVQLIADTTELPLEEILKLKKNQV